MRRATALLIAASALMAAAPPEALTLREAETRAIAHHPRVDAARLDAAAAGQQVREIRSAFFPNVYANFTGAGAGDNTRIAAGALNNPSIYSRFASGFTASQLIFDFGRTSNLESSYRYAALAQQDTTAATEASVLLEVNRAYFGALRAQSVLRVAHATVDARQAVADQVTALANSKLKSGLDVSFARVNLAEAKLLLAGAQNDVEAAFAQLSAAMGEAAPERFELVEESLPPTPPSDFSEILGTAIRKRPELASLRSIHEASLKLLQSEKSLWLPTLSAVTSVGVVPGHSDKLPGDYSAAGVNLSFPVFNGHLFSARRMEADLRAQAAAQRVRNEELEVARDVRIAWLAVEDSWQRLGLARQLLDEARQALDLAQSRYDIGLSSIVELSQAQLALTSAEITQAGAKYEYQTRRAELDYQMGELRRP